MKSYNVKCLSCQSTLNDDCNSVGYVENFILGKTKYCKRCFRLINYNEIQNPKNYEQIINNCLLTLDFDKKLLIFMVLDISNLDESVLINLLNWQEKIIFVVNKIDYLPRNYNFELFQKYVEQTLINLGFLNPKVIFVSKNFNNSIKRLFDLIKKNSLNNKQIIFVGKTNTGKSSLINGLLALNNKNENNTIASPFINTTICLKKIKLNKITIIDTPGVMDSKNIFNYLTYFDIKKITKSKSNKSINFFIDNQQTIMIEQLVFISYLKGRKTSFTFYTNQYINLKRIKTKNLDRNLINDSSTEFLIKYVDHNLCLWKEYTFDLDPNKKHNISINGIGLISINLGAELVKIKVREGVGVNLNLYAII